MKLLWTAAGMRWSALTARAHHLAIPLRFDGPQPSAFHLPQAHASPVEAEGFVGDVRRGGGANCETVQLNPHGNGTHTECVGHILAERYPVHEALRPGFPLAVLLTVEVCTLAESQESYHAPSRPEDLVLSAAALEVAWGFLPAPARAAAPTAWVLRSRGAGAGPRAVYSGQNPAYLTREAMGWLRARGAEHLLVDLPSVDREDDGGALECHHLFWSVPEGRHDFRGCSPEEEALARRRSLTEMIWVPEALVDAIYLLELQIPAFVLDAAPSRPILFEALCLGADDQEKSP